MKIILSALAEGVSSRISETYDPVKLGLELVDCKYLEPLEVDGTLVKENDILTVRVRMTSRVRRICGRTLQELDEPLAVDFERYYPLSGIEEIDILDDLREAVLLEQPMVYFAPGSENADLDTSKNKPAHFERLKDNEGPFSKLNELKKRMKEEKS